MVHRFKKGRLRFLFGSVWALALGLVLAPADAKATALGCSGYCKDECYRLEQSGWQILSTVVDNAMTNPAVSTSSTKVTLRQGRANCATGNLRVRRLDANGRLDIRCIKIEDCSATARAIRVCTTLDSTTGMISYKCAFCGLTVLSTGGCG